MKIESVDFFYLALPHIRDIGDGSQDALLVRVRAGGLEGWGECEASPLVSIAAYVTPMSHSACKSVGSQLEGESVDSPADILRIRRKVQANCLDLLQAPHTLSGIDIALWDLLGKKEQAPVYSLLGYDRALPKTAYASMPFGETPEQTQANVAEAVRRGFRAVKLGWGGYGSDLETDIAHLELARKEAGRDVLLMVDAGTVWTQAEDPVQEAARRLPSLKAAGVLWLEEPFSSYDFDYYSRLAELAGPVNLAGGEGAHNPEMAKHMMRYASLGFVQIDTGRIGGITAAHDVARACMQQHVRYVNHTFTTQLALSASIQPFAGMADSTLCEYPFQPSDLSLDLTEQPMQLDGNGTISLPEAPGLGVVPRAEAIRKYQRTVEMSVDGKNIYTSPVI